MEVLKKYYQLNTHVNCPSWGGGHEKDAGYILPLHSTRFPFLPHVLSTTTAPSDYNLTSQFSTETRSFKKKCPGNQWG